MEGPEPLPSNMSRIASAFLGSLWMCFCPPRRYPSGNTSLFAAHRASLIVLFALFLPLLRAKKKRSPNRR